MPSPIRFEIRERIATMTLDRPDRVVTLKGPFGGSSRDLFAAFVKVMKDKS